MVNEAVDDVRSAESFRVYDLVEVIHKRKPFLNSGDQWQNCSAFIRVGRECLLQRIGRGLAVGSWNCGSEGRKCFRGERSRSRFGLGGKRTAQQPRDIYASTRTHALQSAVIDLTVLHVAEDRGQVLASLHSPVCVARVPPGPIFLLEPGPAIFEPLGPVCFRGALGRSSALGCADFDRNAEVGCFRIDRLFVRIGGD